MAMSDASYSSNHPDNPKVRLVVIFLFYKWKTGLCANLPHVILHLISSADLGTQSCLLSNFLLQCRLTSQLNIEGVADAASIRLSLKPFPSQSALAASSPAPSAVLNQWLMGVEFKGPQVR